MTNIGYINNVKISEVGKKDFTKTNTWSYHLDKNYYFGGINDDGKFEIAWGVGLDNKSATKTYKISYTVVDAVSKYNDCAEIYWQFISIDSSIDAEKIKGTIKLPSKVSSKKDIRVWGHVETLNGEIYATDLDTVEFNIQNYESGNFLEVRIAMPTEMFGEVTRTYNKNMLDNIIEEETEWAEEANARRIKKEKIEELTWNIITGIIIIIYILLIIQFVKYIKILIKTKKINPTQEYQYFREKPNQYSTPADALFLYNKGNGVLEFGNVFSATLLNLSLKGYFEISEENDENGEKQTIIRKTKKDITQLEYEEEKIGMFISLALRNKEKITAEELQNYIKSHGLEINLLIKRTDEEVKSKNNKIGNYNEGASKQKSKYKGIAITYFILAIIPTPFILVSIPLIINAIVAIFINRKLSNLTQKGIDEREKWEGLKRYMEEFSLLNEKEIPALAIWEEYLVYATVFGIADKVIKQLKISYPEIEQMNSFNTHSYVYLMSNTNFNSSFSRAISSSISSTMSSGSGRWRRFLWRRRRRPVAGGSMRRKINKKGIRFNLVPFAIEKRVFL